MVLEREKKGFHRSTKKKKKDAGMLKRRKNTSDILRADLAPLSLSPIFTLGIYIYTYIYRLFFLLFTVIFHSFNSSDSTVRISALSFYLYLFILLTDRNYGRVHNIYIFKSKKKKKREHAVATAFIELRAFSKEPSSASFFHSFFLTST